MNNTGTFNYGLLVNDKFTQYSDNTLFHVFTDLMTEDDVVSIGQGKSCTVV